MKSKSSFIQKTTAFLMTLAMLTPILTVGVTAQSMTKTKGKALTEDQKILHVLNRLGYGARAGDVEKVKAIGLKNYIEQQLNPNSIADPVAESKVQGLDVLKLSNDEMFAKYPAPQAILQVVARENGMKAKDLKAEVKEDKQAKKDAKAGNQDGAMMPNETAKNANPPKALDQMTDQERIKYQAQVQEVYQKYNLGRPQQITNQLNSSRILRAVYSERQLQEQMVDFWSNHFNVYANKQSVRWFLPEYDRDVIRPNSMGNFKDLLMATAKSPAMLYYLDNFESVAPNNSQANGDMEKQQERLKQIMNNPQARERFKQNQGLTDEQLNERIKQMQQRMGQAKKQARGINENYAREIMELHTLGVDGGYSLKDIQEIARCFTGWTITDPRGYRKAGAFTGMDDKRGAKLAQAMGLPENAESGKFYFNEKFHDNGVKMVLGQTINEGGINDGLKVIDILAHHPSTAKFIARKLAVKFVNDNPSEELVNRVAEA